MRYFFGNLFCLLFFAFVVNSQDQSRLSKLDDLKRLNADSTVKKQELKNLEDQQDLIATELLEISESDKQEAARIGAEYKRLFPDGVLDKLVPFPSNLGYSVYSFSDISTYYFSPRVKYENGNLVFVKEPDTPSFGLIANIGGSVLESLNTQSIEVRSLAKYQPPKKLRHVKDIFVSDGLTFKNKTKVVSGSTYIIRAVTLGSGDAIYALKIRRIDPDDSIVVFVKRIIELDKPELDSNPTPRTSREILSDAALFERVQNALYLKGFYAVRLDVKNGVVTLRGEVPKGKMADAVMTAMEAKPKKIENQLTENRN